MDSGYLVRRFIGSTRRFLLFVFLISLFLFIGSALAYFAFGRDEKNPILPSNASLPETGGSEIGTSLDQKLTVNAQLQVNGQVYLAPSALPTNAQAGTLVFDQATNTMQYFDGTQFVPLTAQQPIPPGGVTSLQGQTGAINLIAGSGITINGTTISANATGLTAVNGIAGHVNVVTNGGVATISLPQSITPSAAPTFAGMTLNGDLSFASASSLFVNNVVQTEPGQDMHINAGNDDIIFTSGGRVFQFPANAGSPQTICTMTTGCPGGGGGNFVELAPVTAQSDSSGNASIFINDTGGGNLIQLQSGAVDRFTVANNGNVTIGGSLSLGTPLSVASGGTGRATLAADAVLIGNGTGGINTVANGNPGDCLIATAGAPVFTTCTGDGVGMTSLTLAGSTGTSQTITDGNTITIAAGTNITTTAGATDTVTIATVASPNFTSLTLGTALGYASGGTNATSAQGAINNISGLTTNGDLLYHNGANATRLARGTNGQCLLSTGTTIQWDTCTGAGGVSSVNSFTGAITVQGTANQIIVNNNSGVITLSTPQDINTSSSPTFAALTLGSPLAITSGGTGATTQQGAINNLSGLTTNGDLLYHNGTNAMRLARGTNGQCLISDGTTIMWDTCTGDGVGITSLGGQTGNVQTFANDTNVTIGSAGNVHTLGWTGTLSVARGGTGADNATDARINIGAAASGANSDITSLSGLTTALSVSQGGTGATTQQGAIDNLSGLTTAGDILYHNGSNTVRLARGSNGQCLVSNGSTIEWATCTGDGNTTYSAGAGLQLVSSVFSVDAPTCSGGQYLTWDGSDFSCGTPGGDGVGIASLSLTGTSGTTQTLTDGDTITIAAGTNISTTSGATDRVTIAVVTNPTFSGLITANGGLTFGTSQLLTLNGDSFADLTGSGLEENTGTLRVNASTITIGTLGIANGGTGATTQQAAINNLSGLTTQGDLLYHNGTNVTRLARGSNGQCLISNSTTVLWGSCTGGTSDLTDAGAWTYLTSTTDEFVFGSASQMNAKLAVVGTSDQTQLLVRANATQTNPLVVFQSSSGSEIMRLDARSNSTVYLGYAAGNGNSGTDNVGIGHNALATSTGNYNIAIGTSALQSASGSINSIGIGYWSLFNNNAYDNVAVGNYTLANNSSGNSNTAFGHSALGGVTVGSGNIGLGVNAGGNITSGSNNIIIGANLNAASATGNNQLNIAGILTSSNYATGNLVVGTSDTTGQLLVLDTKTSAGDPTGVNGGMYYNSDAGKFRCYESSAWVDCITSGTGGSLFTDGGTATYLTSTTDELVVGGSTSIGAKLAVVGTSDQTQLIVRANATQTAPLALFQNSAGSELFSIRSQEDTSLFIGRAAGTDMDGGSNYTTAFGQLVLENMVSGTANTAMGYMTMNAQTTGSQNVAIGDSAMRNSTGGGDNTAIGFRSLRYNSGSNNVAVGASAMVASSGNPNASNYNTALGHNSLNAHYSGDGNTALGVGSMRNHQTGSDNVAVGNDAMRGSTTGTGNVALGHDALYNVSGDNNIALGRYAGDDGISGDYNIVIGYNQQVANLSSDYQLNIAGLIQSSDYTTGALDLSTSGAGAINIGTGSSTGAIGIGNSSSGNISLASGGEISLTVNGGSDGLTLGSVITSSISMFRFSSGGTLTTNSQGSTYTQSMALRTGNSGGGIGSGDIIIQTGNGTGTNIDSGDVTIDVGTATGTAGSISIGAANATDVLLGRTGGTITFGDSALSDCILTTVSGVLTCGVGGGDILNGGNAGAVTIGSNNSTLALEANGTSYYTLSTAGLLQGSNGATFSVPGTGSQSERFGAGTTASGNQSLAVGNGASATSVGALALGYGSSSESTGAIAIGMEAVADGDYGVAIGIFAYSPAYGVAIGLDADATGGEAIAIGSGAETSAFRATALGAYTSAGHQGSIALGASASTTAANQLVIGSSAESITSVRIGNGVTNATPQGFTLQGTSGSGSNVAGASVTIAGGQGTGTGAGGAIILQTAAFGSSGSSLNSLTTRLTVEQGGNVVVGQSDTTGSLLVLDTKTNSGDPTGVNGGMYYNSNSGQFRFYQNGSWVSLGTGDILNGGQNGAITIGTNNANSLILETNGVARLTIDSSGNGVFVGNLSSPGTGGSEKFGAGAEADGDSAAFGAYSKALAGDSLALGYSAEATGVLGSTAIGYDATSGGLFSIALGNQAVANGDHSLVAGYQSTDGGFDGAIILGSNKTATSNNYLNIAGLLTSTDYTSGGNWNGSLAVTPASDSTTTFRVTNAAGNWDGIRIDTVNNLVGIGMPGWTLPLDPTGAGTSLWGHANDSQEVATSLLGRVSGRSTGHQKGVYIESYRDEVLSASGWHYTGTYLRNWGSDLTATTSSAYFFGTDMEHSLQGASGQAAHATNMRLRGSYGAQIGSVYGLDAYNEISGTVGTNRTISVGAYGSGTVTNNYAIYVENQTLGTNDYGLYIQGADTYALWVDAGVSRFDGDLTVNTDTLFVDATNNRVGIGTATPSNTSVLHVAGTAPTTANGSGLLVSTILARTSLGHQHGVYIQPYIDPASASTAFYHGGSFSPVSMSNNVAGAQINGISAFPAYGGTDTLGTMYGVNVTMNNLATGTISTAHGIHVNTPANVGTITDNYGIYIQNQNVGTNDYGLYIQGADTYALWVDAGVSRFDGNVVLDAALPAGDNNTQVCRASTGVLSTCTSSQRYKTNVAAASMGLAELRQLQPVTYTWTSTGQDDFGFIAEQVAAVIPQAVTYDSNGEVASFNYNTISALLVSAVKQLDLKVEALETRLVRVEQGYFAGNITVGGKIISDGNPASAVLGAQAANNSQVVISGNDIAGKITYQTGNSGLTTGEQIKVVFSSPYDKQPRITLTPASSEAAAVRYYVERNNSQFTIHFIDAPAGSATYEFDYQVIQ